MMTTVKLDTPAAIRASDADRERALDLLRVHWLAGRLTLEEYEQRCEDAAGARFLDDLRSALRELPYPPPAQAPAPAPAAAPARRPRDPQASAVLSVVLGTISLVGVLMSFGLLFMLTLPASTWAWSLGRRTRRGAAGAPRTIAALGEGLGAVATALGCLALAACATFVAAL
jgi:uncharacterized protein DUF1707